MSRLSTKSPQWLMLFAQRILHEEEFKQLSKQHRLWAEFINQPWGSAVRRFRDATDNPQGAPPLHVEDKHDQNPDLKAPSPRVITLLAGRWAAKEAARKAWGAKFVGDRDVRVDIIDGSATANIKGSGAPRIICQLADDFGKPEMERFSQEGLLSLSHDGDYCVATVIAEPLNLDLMERFKRKRTTVWRMVHKAPLDQAEHQHNQRQKLRSALAAKGFTVYD